MSPFAVKVIEKIGAKATISGGLVLAAIFTMLFALTKDTFHLESPNHQYFFFTFALLYGSGRYEWSRTRLLLTCPKSWWNSIAPSLPQQCFSGDRHPNCDGKSVSRKYACPVRWLVACFVSSNEVNYWMWNFCMLLKQANTHKIPITLNVVCLLWVRWLLEWLWVSAHWSAGSCSPMLVRVSGLCRDDVDRMQRK